MPRLIDLIVLKARHFCLKQDLVPDAKLIGAPIKVGKQLIALRKVARPIWVAMKRVRIKMIRGVNTAVGVAIFVPRATNLIVSLNNREGNASSFQLRCHS